jgi:hypothetical protein
MTSESDELTAEEPVPLDRPDSAGEPLGATALPRRRPRPLTVVSTLALALFALWGIGTPLVGASTLTATNEMVTSSPYYESGFAGTKVTNSFMDDTYTSGTPQQILYKASLHDSLRGAQWNPYTNGGGPLGAVPDDALLSPLTIPYYVLPTWLAPAYERLLEIVVAAGGSFLFLRRLKLSAAASVTGGLVYAGSAFMVVWLDFPQTRVAAFIPALFWTLERYLQQRRLRDAALISIPVAAMLLGGFPAVTGFALLTAAAYGVVRVTAQFRTRLRDALRPAVGATFGAVAGVGLAAFQLLPFSAFLGSWYTDGRAQTSGQHLDATSILTAIAPWAFGTVNPQRPPQFYLPTNLIEAMSYLSAAAAVLVVVAVGLQNRGRALLPRGMWVFFVASAAVWAELIYFGGPLLGALQKLPGSRALFATNFVGRSRSVLGFLLAVLVAVGLELLLRQRAANAVRSRAGLWWAGGIGAAAAVSAAVLVWNGERDAAAQQRSLRLEHAAGNALGLYRHQIFTSALLVLAAVVCVAAVLLAERKRGLPGYDQVWRTVRFAGAAGLPLLIAGQGITFVTQYYPHSPKDTFYPVTDTHSYLATNLGDQRYASSGSAMVFGTNTAYGLRAVNGHAFTNSALAELIKLMPGDPLPVAPYISFDSSVQTAANPILDTLGTKYFVANIDEAILGNHTEAMGDGSLMTLRPGQPITVPVPSAGRLRGVGVLAQGTIPPTLHADDPGTWIEVTVRDASTGAWIADSKRPTTEITTNSVFTIPVAADSLAATTRLNATLTLHAKDPLSVAAVKGTSLALTTVAGADDGLTLVHVGTNAIYLRLNAQPRIRWAAQSKVVADQRGRIGLLAAGSVAAHSVLLDSPGPAASGQPAKVTVNRDGTDTISTTVDAQGFGYLVVADADQVGWTASVDGRRTSLVDADQGVVAVPVPAGRHSVTLRFTAPRGTLGYTASAVTAVGLLAVVLGELWWTRRRRETAVTDTRSAGREH